MLDVNLRGVVIGVMAAYPLMVRQRSGQIVHVASLGGLESTAFAVPYAASKHAVGALSTSLRCEAADYGVRVSVQCAGAIETPLLDRGPLMRRPTFGRITSR
jgi:NAD(P)-dependent dehydrogenase (short-subunit alcohol dehydrogenase family)